MEIYRSNRNCSCMRCRCRGIMGGVVLITLGFMFLLDEFHVRDLSFDNLIPLLLIAIGIVLMLQRSAPMDGHVQPGMAPYPMPPVPPPPITAIQPAGTMTVVETSDGSSEVRHE